MQNWNQPPGLLILSLVPFPFTDPWHKKCAQALYKVNGITSFQRNADLLPDLESKGGSPSGFPVVSWACKAGSDVVLYLSGVPFYLGRHSGLGSPLASSEVLDKSKQCKGGQHHLRGPL